MNLVEKQEALARILCGRLCINVGTIQYVVCQPSLDTLYEAQRLYSATTYTQSFNEDWLSEEEARQVLVHFKLIPPDYDKVLEDLETRQDDVKVDMYNSYLNKESLEKHRHVLGLVKKKIEDLINNRHIFDYLTYAGYAAMVRNQFLMSRSIYVNKKRLWKRDEDVDYCLLNSIMEKVNNAYITHASMRLLSRTDPWRSYWSASSTNLFGKPVAKWTEEQKLLVAYSKMYDNIFKHPDCPQDAIIQDDDVLDGWTIKLRRERESDRKQNEIIEILGEKHKNDTEIFLPARNVEEAREIESYNTADAKRIKAQRAQILNQRGTVAEQELPDVMVDRLNSLQGNRNG